MTDIEKRRDYIAKVFEERKTERDKLKLQKQLEAKEFQSDVENDAYFFNTFSAEIAEINEDIEKLKNAAAQLTDSEKNEDFLAINSRCEQARTFLRDSTRFLNKHRIQSCSEAVDGILQKTSALRSEIQPKKKFTFKSRKIASKAPTATVESTEDKNKKFSIECGFQDKSKEILTIKDVNDRNVELDNIQDCIIHIEGNPSTVHCRHIKQSTILIGPVTTSVFIDSCNDSVFALSCQQLRCHDSSFCQFYLHVTSNAIIENCKKFEFAENTYSYSDMKKDYDRSKLNETNNWMNVKDFNWLSDTEASPNWSKISHSEMIHDWTDKLVIETTRIANLSSS